MPIKLRLPRMPADRAAPAYDHGLWRGPRFPAKPRDTGRQARPGRTNSA